MLSGIVTEWSTSFPSSGLPQLTISGYDHFYRMTRGTRSKNWESKKDSDVVREIARDYNLEAKVGGAWQALYAFELHEQQLVDYEVSNWYLCNHPGSKFVTGIVAARAERDRRHALRNTRYVVHHDDGKTEKRFLGTVAEYKETLAGPFKIRLPDAPHLDAKLVKLIEENPATA